MTASQEKLIDTIKKLQKSLNEETDVARKLTIQEELNFYNQKLESSQQLLSETKVLKG